ncbi:U-box domain-containing protein 17 [Artemisia annua]|uniref:U-box domain-containing protein 17 n=1 Tax=Artemisia annua TaxID=35608 RepID=A0A2U1MN46_ARTAN|nr:U-box domain-containing protein 17 [Artemisia annua]
MPGRPPHKRKKDAGEKDDRNRTRVERKGVIMHCSLCKGEGHNVRGCPTRKEGESVGEASCGKAVRGGKTMSVRGGFKTRGGGKSSVGAKTRGGGQQAKTRGGGQRSATGEQEAATDGETMLGTVADEIPLSNSQPMASQEPIDEETSPTHATPVVPAQPDVPAPTIAPAHAPAHALGIRIRRPFVPFMRRESERIKQIVFKRPPPPGPGLTPDDAMLVD